MTSVWLEHLLYNCMVMKSGKKTSKTFNCFLNISGESDVSKFQGVHSGNLPKMENLLQLKIYLYNMGFLNEEITGEFASRSTQKFEESVWLLAHSIHICYVTEVISLFEAFRCSTSDTFFCKIYNIERILVTCTERMKHIYPKIVYELKEAIFDKLDTFSLPFEETYKET